MTKPTLAVVGHGIVGARFLEQCVSRQICICIITLWCLAKNVMPPMTGCICQSISPGAARNHFRLCADDFFARNGIELRLGQCVTGIDREMRVIRNADGHETHWDSLVLATGSYPFVPL